MSYLLTEIAMEMLGWQFYDTDGVARPINLEGLNVAKTNGAKPLEEALGIHFLDTNFSVKAEADSSSIEASDLSCSVDDSKVCKLGIDNKNDFNWDANVNEKSEPFIMNNATNNMFNLKIQSVVGGVDLTCDGKPIAFQTKVTCNETEFQNPSTSSQKPTMSGSALETSSQSKPVTIRQKSPGIEKSITNSTFALNWNIIKASKLSVPQQLIKSNMFNSDNTSANKSKTDEPTDFELKQLLENELLKTALDINREKTRFYKNLNLYSGAKPNPQILRKAIEKYRAQEFGNLQNELKNLYELRQKAEHLCAAKFPKTYPKYLTFSNALNNNELLQRTQLTIPASSDTNKP